MRRRNHNKNLTISIILLLILSIGIGYAYLTSNLSISGTTEIAGNTWNIHFENLQVTEGSVTATTPATIQSNTVDITYSIVLTRPKDFYEFTVDVKNDGTLPGKVSISTLSGITTAAAPVVDYTITYTNGRAVNIGDILNAGSKKTIKVRVFYKDDIIASDLPSFNLNLSLTYTLQYLQSEVEEVNASNLLQNLASTNSCITKYTGNVTDQVGQTVAANNVYFDKCSDKRNIIFNNMCWQIIRTTETGGMKLLYNGEPDQNGECGTSRADHKGIVQSNYGIQNMDSSYLYGSSFTYDTSTSEFTLVDTFTATWSDSTYENLIGKFTCKSASDTCTTLYETNSYVSSTEDYVSYYTIADTNYAQIGTSSYNTNYESPAMVGYMFNKVYNYSMGAPISGSLTGNDVSYSNGTYTLVPPSGVSELGTSLNYNHHYSCNSTTSTCSKVQYYFCSTCYIELDGAANIEAAVNEMLYNDDVNTYNSSIKGIVDSWYAQNLSSKTSLLEDTIFCNARNMTNQSTNGWNKDGSFSTYMNFKNYSLNTNISCPNATDQFAVANNKAKLTYPVGLLRDEERYNINISSLMATGAYYWEISPYQYLNGPAFARFVSTSGSNNSINIDAVYGARPVVSLAPSVVINEGTGSTTDPWIVQE